MNQITSNTHQLYRLVVDSTMVGTKGALMVLRNEWLPKCLNLPDGQPGMLLTNWNLDGQVVKPVISQVWNDAPSKAKFTKAITAHHNAEAVSEYGGQSSTSPICMGQIFEGYLWKCLGFALGKSLPLIGLHSLTNIIKVLWFPPATVVVKPTGTGPQSGNYYWSLIIDHCLVGNPMVHPTLNDPVVDDGCS